MTYIANGRYLELLNESGNRVNKFPAGGEVVSVSQSGDRASVVIMHLNGTKHICTYDMKGSMLNKRQI